MLNVDYINQSIRVCRGWWWWWCEIYKCERVLKFGSGKFYFHEVNETCQTLMPHFNAVTIN